MTIQRQTPAQRKGLNVGDEVRITTHSRGFHGKVFLHYDDHTSIPQFRDEYGTRHYVTLNDVVKVERAVPAPKPELFKCGDIVSAEVRGTRIVGVVDAVGDLLLGIKKGIDGKGSYEAPLKASAKQATPAERVGLKIGDVVTVNGKDGLDHDFTLNALAYFNYDDGTSQPRFIQHGETQYLDLRDITIGKHVKPRVEDGPKPGVKWSDAPEGATHYSMRPDHVQKWHKLSESGVWAYSGGRSGAWHEYSGAHPDTQVAIPGITVVICPSFQLQKELDAIATAVNARQAQFNTAQRDLRTAQDQRTAKLEEIQRAGFKVESGKLVKIEDGPDTWKDGDIVRCIKREGKGLAAIIVGGKYRVKVDTWDGKVRVVDAEGDAMLTCVENGCFEMFQRNVGLVDVPARSWKRGDVVESLVNGVDIVKGKRYTLLGIDVDGYVQHRDDVGAHRTRPPQQYKLVARS